MQSRCGVNVVDIPIKFPNEYDKLYEEGQRFRALSPEAQIRELDGMFALYHYLKGISGRAAEIDRFADEDERLGWQAVREFEARHG